MKAYKFIFSLIALCLFYNITYAGDDDAAYQYQDSLIVKVDENVKLMLVSDNLYKFDAADSIDKMVSNFNKDILKIEQPDIDDSFVKIYYHTNSNGSGRIKYEDVTENDKNYLVLQNGDALSPMPVELVMDLNKDNRLSIFIPGPEYFEDLGNYKFGNLLSGILEKAKKEDPSMKRKQLTLIWVLDEHEPGGEFHEINFNTESNDMIVLSGSVAASLVRDKLVPSIDARLGIILGKKTYQRHMINAEASMMYIFNKKPEGSYSTDINTFLGLSYYYNPSKNPDKPRWFGVGLSYLVCQNGDFFGENTWRLTMGARFGKHFTVLPELYFGDNFNEIMPGLRMQVSF